MNKSKFYRPDRLHMVGFLICATLFLLGCVAGAIASGGISASGYSESVLPPDTQVNEYFASLAGAESRSFGARFLSELRISGKFHVLVVFFAFSAIGVAAIPAVMALRGFLLCFAAASVIRGFGVPGVPYALVMFAPEALVAIPGLFVLATHSMLSSVTLLRACLPRSNLTEQPFGAAYVRRAAFCLALVCVSAFIDAAAAPWLAARFLG